MSHIRTIGFREGLLRNPTRRVSQLSLAALLMTFIWAFVVGSTVQQPDPVQDPTKTDLNLYQVVADRVAAGEPYYVAAVREQTERGYPVEPAPTVRMPTTTYANLFLGELGAQLLIYGLIGLAFGLALVRFNRISPNRIEWLASVALLTVGLALSLVPDGTYFSETWAGILIFLAAIVGPARKPWLSIAFLVGALAFRELALLAIPGVVILLWLGNHRRLAATWAAIALAFTIGYLTLHAGLVAHAVDASVVGPPAASEGWVRFGGWPLVVDFARRITLFQLLPFWVSAAIIPLSVCGLAMRRSPETEAMLASASGFLLAFMIIGRDNTAYWGFLYILLLLPGLAFAPLAVGRLFANSFRTQNQ